MKTQFTVYRCTELRKAVQLDVGKFLLYVLFMKIRVKKVIKLSSHYVTIMYVQNT